MTDFLTNSWPIEKGIPFQHKINFTDPKTKEPLYILVIVDAEHQRILDCRQRSKTKPSSYIELSLLHCVGLSWKNDAIFIDTFQNLVSSFFNNS